MNAEQRAKLLRERCKTKPVAKASARPEHWPKRVRYVVLPKPTGRGFVSCGPQIAQNRPAWVETPDATTKPTVSTKRRKGAHALTRISQQLHRERTRA